MKATIDGVPQTANIQGPDAPDAVPAGNPVADGSLATEDVASESDVTAGALVRNLATRKGAPIIVPVIAVGSIADGIGNGVLNRVLTQKDIERDAIIATFGLGYDRVDSHWDRLTTLGNTAGAGQGVQAAAPWIPGASDVKSISVVVGATSVNRATVLTPTSGKKIRVVSVKVANKSTTSPDKVGVYFGTGAAYLTNATTVIGEYVPTADGSDGESWPDGGGPVGAADEVVSWITETETEVGLDGTIQYREE